jgi:hypothetical protein
MSDVTTRVTAGGSKISDGIVRRRLAPTRE